jgi:hypothetical protein
MMEALDLYSRLNMGQFDEAWRAVEESPRFSKESLEAARECADELSRACFPSLEGGSYFGIVGPGVSDKAKRSWEVYSAIRHTLSWAKHPEGGITVNFDKPMSLTGEKFPEVVCEL